MARPTSMIVGEMRELVIIVAIAKESGRCMTFTFNQTLNYILK